MDEPRTALDIWRDALDLLQEREFYYGYDDRYAESYTSCETCKAKVWHRGNAEPNPEHRDDCRLANTLRELAAFIAAEEELEAKKGGA